MSLFSSSVKSDEFVTLISEAGDSAAASGRRGHYHSVIASASTSSSSFPGRPYEPPAFDRHSADRRVIVVDPESEAAIHSSTPALTMASASTTGTGTPVATSESSDSPVSAGTMASVASDDSSKKSGWRRRLFGRFSKTKEEAVDERIHKRLKTESRVKPLSVWLLGAGGSGKTTVRKQMQYYSVMSRRRVEQRMEGTLPMHRDSISVTLSHSQTQTPLDPALLTEMSGLDVTSIIDNMHHNLLTDIVELCNQNWMIREGTSSYYQSQVEQSEIDVFKLDLANELNEERLTEFLRVDCVRHVITPALAESIEALWEDPGIQATFELRRQSHIMDSTEYFMAKVRAIAKVDYTPSWDDWVHIRDTTSGFVTKEVEHFDSKSGRTLMCITDCGGQRNERKKWFRILERSGGNIDVCVWVVAVSSYDQLLFEDHSQNCLTEAFQLFNAIVHHPVFHGVDFFVFLNKMDLFERKIQRVPFTVHKPDFPKKKAHDPAAVIHWIKEEFRRIFASPHFYKDYLTVQTRFFHTDTPSPASSRSRGSASRSRHSKSRSRGKMPFDSEMEDSGACDERRSRGSRGSKARAIPRAKRNLIFKETCATDTEKISKVIQFVQVNSIRDKLARMGLVT